MRNANAANSSGLDSCVPRVQKFAMRDDLLEALAGVDWTIAQLPAFENRMKTWLNENIEVDFVDTPMPATNDAIVAREKSPLPLDFNVEAGAYINTIRSSLDILACAIGKREMVLNPDSVYYPVAASAADFAARNYKGSEFVRQLSGDSRTVIEKFQPYYGGYDCVWATHDLDIMRKHKRLLAVMVRPARWHITGWGVRDNYTPLAVSGFIDAGNGETALGLYRKGADKPQVEVAMHVVFDKGTALPGRAAIRTIKGLADGVGVIIRAFDF
jgi:hypothetical protein